MTVMSIVFNPIVSIIIPVFNGADFLAEAIDSALAQTYKNIEIIVINDGSDDAGATERIALSYGDRIRYFKKPNGGVASALNMGVDKMAGEYFSWLSHDDLYVNEKIERQIEFLSSQSSETRGRIIVYSDFYVFTTDSEKATPVLMRGVEPANFRYWLTIENTLHGCTLLIPRTAFIEVDGFNEQLRTTQDYDLWFRMAKSHPFVHLPGRLVKARSHPEQGSITMSGLVQSECNALLSGFVVNLTRDELLRARQGVSVAYADIAASMWQRGFFKTGWLATRLSCKNLPRSSVGANILAVRIILNGLSMHYIIKSVRKCTPASARRRIKTWLESKRTKKILHPASLHHRGLKEKFAEIYEKNIFGGRESRSGEGSDLVQTDTIRREIPTLLQDFGIKTFLDAPCGDWYWMRTVDLPVEQYIGVDIVDALVDKNQSEYGDAKISFKCLNLAVSDLPKVDLIFSRDCLVHLSFQDALKIIANFKRSGAKYLLTTTFVERERNEDLGDGFWRPLNKQIAPFSFPKPIKLINEGCTEGNHLFTDKCLGLWLLDDIKLEEAV